MLVDFFFNTICCVAKYLIFLQYNLLYRKIHKHMKMAVGTIIRKKRLVINSSYMDTNNNAKGRRKSITQCNLNNLLASKETCYKHQLLFLIFMPFCFVYAYFYKVARKFNRSNEWKSEGTVFINKKKISNLL